LVEDGGMDNGDTGLEHLGGDADALLGRRAAVHLHPQPLGILVTTGHELRILGKDACVK
jgi:hypothetical protein